VLPAIGVMLLVIAYPIYYTIYLSFFNTPPNLALEDKIFVGVDNYSRILAAESFHEATWNTVVWTLWSTFVAFVLGFGAALGLNRVFSGRALLRGVLLVPYVISAVAASYLAGLQAVPDQLLRAARVDGAGAWSRFWHITVPHVRSVMLVTVLLLLVTNLNSFTIPYIMTGGGPAGASEIWITHIYQIAFGRIRFGLASAYSVVLFIVMMAMGYFYVRALTQGDDKAPR